MAGSPIPSASSMLPMSAFIAPVPGVWPGPITLAINITMILIYPVAFNPNKFWAGRNWSCIIGRSRTCSYNNCRGPAA